ncbi:homeobox protein MSX-1-like [Oscarella lobularis]|uniref:homeobox protein MSX-1-like n=1 Tax=Oscarella lobularis TaxID=121494 RepID=UPI0033133433
MSDTTVTTGRLSKHRDRCNGTKSASTEEEDDDIGAGGQRIGFSANGLEDLPPPPPPAPPPPPPPPPLIATTHSRFGPIKSSGRQPRSQFSAYQIDMLSRRFERCRYVSYSERVHMARELSMSEHQVKVWFQNRRTKERRKRENNEVEKAKEILYRTAGCQLEPPSMSMAIPYQCPYSDVIDASTCLHGERRDFSN